MNKEWSIRMCKIILFPIVWYCSHQLSLILCKEKLLDLAVQYLTMDLKEGEAARCETRRKAAREKKRRQRMSKSPAHRKKANNEHQRQSRARRCTEVNSAVVFSTNQANWSHLFNIYVPGWPQWHHKPGIPGQGERLSTEVPRCWSVLPRANYRRN